MDDETTMRVFKKDALIMKQLQSLLDLHKKRMTQAELLHCMFDFIADYEEEFFREIERQKKLNDKLMNEWNKIIFKKMREL